MFKVEFSNDTLQTIQSGDCKDDIRSKVHKVYADREGIIIMESTYNMMVTYKRCCKELGGRAILHFTFDEKEKLLRMVIYDMKGTGFDCFLIRDTQIRENDIVEFIRSGENFEFWGHCIVIENRVDSNSKVPCSMENCESCDGCRLMEKKFISAEFPKENVFIRIDEISSRYLELSSLDKRVDLHTKYACRVFVSKGILLDGPVELDD